MKFGEWREGDEASFSPLIELGKRRAREGLAGRLTQRQAAAGRTTFASPADAQSLALCF